MIERGTRAAGRPLALAIGALLLCTPTFAQSADTAVVRTQRLVVRMTPASGELSLAVLDSSGTTVHTAPAPGLYVDGTRQSGFVAIETGPRVMLRGGALDVTIEPVDARAIALTATTRDGEVHALELHLTSDDGTAYYGTGERFNALNQRGYIVPMLTDDRYGNKGVGSHKPVPFVMSSHGFGVWVDSWAPGTFDLSGAQRFETRLSFDERRLRVVFMAGPRLAEVLEEFTALTGRPRVPPPWAFGLWKSRDVHHNQDSVLVDVERLRSYGIPASVLVLDSPWETGYNDFIINRAQFRDPESMFARIEELGFVLCLWLTPFINQRDVQDMDGVLPVSSNWDEAVRGGHLVRRASGEVALSEWWKGSGGLIDFTDPKAIDWWLGQLRRTKAYGARAFKVDDGEGNFVPDAVFADGTPARLMKNRYGTLYDSVMQAYIDRDLGGDGVLITRSGSTGANRFPFAWAGDNESSFSFADGLPSVVIAGQNAAMSGIALWGTDIAGYAGRPSKDVFIRWTQFAAFTPFMQVHMTSNLGPWDFDEQTLEIFRRFAVLRTRLFPYLYDAAHEAARTGMPAIRPMPLAFEGDAEARRHLYQYMYGPDLLVAPIIQPGTHRIVYLPAGRWVDYWTGVAMDGPRTIEVEAPLERMPLFVRAGAILPMLPADVQTLVPRNARMARDVVTIDERRVLQIWPGAAGSLRTHDGIVATVERAGADVTLRFSAKAAVPLAIELPYARATLASGVDARAVADTAAGATVIRPARPTKEATIRWTETKW